MIHYIRISKLVLLQLGPGVFCRIARFGLGYRCRRRRVSRFSAVPAVTVAAAATAAAGGNQQWRRAWE